MPNSTTRGFKDPWSDANNANEAETQALRSLNNNRQSSVRLSNDSLPLSHSGNPIRLNPNQRLDRRNNQNRPLSSQGYAQPILTNQRSLEPTQYKNQSSSVSRPSRVSQASQTPYGQSNRLNSNQNKSVENNDFYNKTQNSFGNPDNFKATDYSDENEEDTISFGEIMDHFKHWCYRASMNLAILGTLGINGYYALVVHRTFEAAEIVQTRQEHNEEAVKDKGTVTPQTDLDKKIQSTQVGKTLKDKVKSIKGVK